MAKKLCPGSKIKSDGKGRGLGRGKGKGPRGVPIGKKGKQMPEVATEEKTERLANLPIIYGFSSNKLAQQSYLLDLFAKGLLSQAKVDEFLSEMND